MNGALAVARYTLLELTRRRILLIFFIIGALGIAALGIGLKVFAEELVPRVETGGQGPSPEQFRQLTELSFVSDLLSVLGLFALLIAFSIGMTAIYHDIESGAAVAIFSKPVSRFAFTIGKIAAALAGNHVGDIGHAIQRVAEEAGYSVVRELVGHGIGSSFHEEPQVPNYGKPKRGARLVPGMTIAIEPMVNMGRPEIRTLDDKWTVVTADGSLSAHFEHTVVIEPGGPRLLTAAPVTTPA